VTSSVGLSSKATSDPRAGPHHLAPGLPFELLETKLRPPHVSARSVARTRLVERLDDAGCAPIVVVCAAAGYGKTTALAQWVVSRPRPDVAWVSVDAHDDDPVVLLTYVAAAIDRIATIDSGVFEALASPGASIETKVVPRLGAALGSVDEPIMLVLDDVHTIGNPRCIDAIVALAAHLSEGSRLVLSTRDPSAFPLARWRTLALTRELGPDDLRMDEEEARALLGATTAGLSDEDAASLVRRTEGWPAGLYLAALSARARGTTPSLPLTLTGNDPFVAAFLRSELLASLPSDEVRFLTRTSVLEQLSGPLCDAILQSSGSGEMLESLAHSNRFVVALDSEQSSYRCHPLVRELLESELERTDHDARSPMLERASDWCAEHGQDVAAIRYGQADGDADRVAALLERFAQTTFHSGRTATVEQWFRWLREHGEPQRYPAVAVIAAMFHAVTGESAECDLWSAAAARGSRDAPLPDGSDSLESWQAMLRAIRCRDGVKAMHADAALAVRTLAPASPWLPPSLFLLGLSELLRGFDDRADDRFVDAGDTARVLATTGATPVVIAVALAERVLVAIEQAEWARADTLAEQAVWTARHSRSEEAGLHALVYAAAARTALHAERETTARELLTAAQRRLPLLTYVCPIPAVQTRLEMARAYLLLADHAGARTMLGEVDGVLRRCPDLGTLGTQADELRMRLDSPGHDAPGASALTAAELRVLPLLATHLSYREIGERRFLSRHTVKSHTMAIYRKLDVNSRSAAVARAHEIGLL
jgi:LuxR family transcriptional regulator, maltose regulon positive regulatory protein